MYTLSRHILSSDFSISWLTKLMWTSNLMKNWFYEKKNEQDVYHLKKCHNCLEWLIQHTWSFSQRHQRKQCLQLWRQILNLFNYSYILTCIFILTMHSFPLIYSFIHLLIHSFTYSLIHFSIHLFISHIFI